MCHEKDSHEPRLVGWQHTRRRASCISGGAMSQTLRWLAKDAKLSLWVARNAQRVVTASVRTCSTIRVRPERWWRRESQPKVPPAAVS